MKGLVCSVTVLFALGVMVAGCSAEKSAEAPAPDYAMMEPPVAAPAAPAVAPQVAAPHAPAGNAPAPAPARAATGRVPEETHQDIRPPRQAQPETVTLTIPSGTNLGLIFDAPLSSETAQTGDPVTVRLASAILVGDRVVFPADSEVRGTVSDVKPASKGFKDTGGAISVSFSKIVAPGGRSATISAGFTKLAEGSAGKKAAIIGGSAVGGALLGKVFDKDEKGAALIGGAIGTAVAGSTKGREAVVKAGEEVPVALEKSARTTLPR